MQSPKILNKEFRQWAQKCTICGSYLLAGETLINDPRPNECNEHIIHKDCLSPLDNNPKVLSKKRSFYEMEQEI